MYEYSGLASELAKKGRFGDSMVMHVNPMEVKILSDQGMVTTNPHTGQPEAFLPLLLNLIPSLLSAAAPVATGIGTGLAAIPGVGTALAAIPNAVGGVLSTLGTAGTNALGLSTAAKTGVAAAAPSSAITSATTVPTISALPSSTLPSSMGTLSMPSFPGAAAPTGIESAVSSAMNVPTISGLPAGSNPLTGTLSMPASPWLGTAPVGPTALESAMIPSANTIGTGIANIPPSGLGATTMQGIGEGIGQFFGSPSLDTAGNALSSITEPLASAGEWGMANPGKALMGLGLIDYLAQDDEADIFDDTVTGEPYDAALGERVDPPPGYTPGIDPEWLYFQDRLRKMADGGIVWRGSRWS